ncbi:hypothetical protein QUB80_03450 [Chlorogloeopsis sp. ULAP01]|uniref:hypothetical protein n=1 Tax=Chlorogloeopsis sp. ULAP01 TaxID=3056483 RepID=UPI0025AB5024|nr:hypothetical protein [Chlorogloeopsis sp. ULAP01]MDM9379754.1 hypothetical protein [Chlorogloeopsis sp. ULAP01]
MRSLPFTRTSTTIPSGRSTVDEVIEHDDPNPNRLTWKASAGPFPFELETEIVEMHPNELIVWRGWRSNWEEEGNVRFTTIDDTTQIEVTIQAQGSDREAS